MVSELKRARPFAFPISIPFNVKVISRTGQPMLRRAVDVSTRELRKEAKNIAKGQKITTFGGSVNWVYAFIRRCTHIAQKLPGDYEDKLLDLQCFIIRQRKNCNYDLTQIGNADQTPLTFDMPYNTRVNNKGAKSVQLNTKVT